MKYKVIPPTIDDALELSLLIAESIEFFHGNNFSDEAIAVWKDAYTEDEMRTKILQRESLILSIEGELAGIIQFDPPEIKSVYVSPKFIGRGHGKILVEEMLLQLKKANIKEVMLYCTTYVVEFYLKIGFVNQGPVTTYWGGVPYEEFKLTKRL